MVIIKSAIFIILLATLAYADLVEVKRAIDGDTVELTNGEKVRLLGVDTPERGEKGYKEAKDYTSKATKGKKVDIKFSKKRDKYGRLLGDVKTKGSSLSKDLIKKGLGKPYYGGKRGKKASP